MEAAGIVLLAVVSAVLFYRFVERRHKVLLAKIAALGLTIGALGVLALYVSSRADARRAEAQRLSVSVRYSADPTRHATRLDALIAAADGDTLDRITFEICNHGGARVTRVSFVPESYRSERSTAHEVVVSPESGVYRSNILETDYILDPEQCRTLTWSPGPFVVFDSVAARVLSADTK